MKIVIPGNETLCLDFLVLDYNGTIACDGEILPGVAAQIVELSSMLEVHVVTADTHGNASARLLNLPVHFQRIAEENQAEAKSSYIEGLGYGRVVAVGNGKNDRDMLKRAVLGIAVMENEGCYTESMHAADVVCRSIEDALNLLLMPKRLIALLRN